MPWLATAFMAIVGHAIKDHFLHRVLPSDAARSAGYRHWSTTTRRGHARRWAALIVPRLQDGELARGAIGRLRVFNDLPSYAVAVKCIRLKAGVEDESLSVPEALASVMGTSLQALTTQYTMLPYAAHAAVDGASRTQCPWPSPTLRRLGLALPRAHAYFCRSCVASDLVAGYSYWRREHQLPGAYVCQLHGEPLLRTPDLSAFDDQPSEAMANAELEPLATDPETSESDAVARFQLFAEVFLRRSSPIDKATYAAAVMRRGAEHGFVTRPGIKCRRISELVSSNFPPGWLLDVFPGIAGVSPGELFAPIDYVLKPTGYAATAGHCAALALLYRSPAEFFEAMAAERSTVNGTVGSGD